MPPLMISRFLRLSTYIAVFHVDQLEPYLWIIVSSLDLSEIWVHWIEPHPLCIFSALGSHICSRWQPSHVFRYLRT